MSPEANLLRIAYIDINTLLVEGFSTTAQELVDSYREAQATGLVANFEEWEFVGVAETLTAIRDLFGADDLENLPKPDGY